MRNGANGFTLIEILIAMTVFAIGFIAVAIMQTVATGGNANAISISDATNLASQAVEELMAIDKAQLDTLDQNGDGAGGLANMAPPTEALLPGEADGQVVVDSYTLTWNVAVDYPVPNATTLRVLVTENFGLRGRTVDLESVKMM